MASVARILDPVLSSCNLAVWVMSIAGIIRPPVAPRLG
jgi:hypothetical protein